MTILAQTINYSLYIFSFNVYYINQERNLKYHPFIKDIIIFYSGPRPILGIILCFWNIRLRNFGTGTKFVKIKNIKWIFWYEQSIIQCKSTHLMFAIYKSRVKHEIPSIKGILIFILVPVPNWESFWDLEIYTFEIWDDGEKICEI